MYGGVKNECMEELRGVRCKQKGCTCIEPQDYTRLTQKRENERDE
jgi:hypothetical protein